MHKRASLGLAIVIMVFAGWGTMSALAWPLKAKLFPLVIGIPLFCLAAAEALWTIFGRAERQTAADFQLSTGQAPEVARKRTLVAAAWTVGFFVLIVLLGFQIAVPVLVFAYLKL